MLRIFLIFRRFWSNAFHRWSKVYAFLLIWSLTVSCLLYSSNLEFLLVSFSFNLKMFTSFDFLFVLVFLFRVDLTFEFRQLWFEFTISLQLRSTSCCIKSQWPGIIWSDFCKKLITAITIHSGQYICVQPCLAPILQVSLVPCSWLVLWPEKFTRYVDCTH